MTTVDAIIIARGGSRRLPRKNAKEFCGLPLLAWSVIQAKCSHLIDNIYLSTDDDEMAAIGEEWGAEIITRPEWEDADLVAANRVYLHALDWLEERGRLPERFVSLFPTSPLRKPDDLDKGIAHMNIVGGPHVYPCSRNRETFISKDVMGLIAKGILWDKSQTYLTNNSGMYNICWSSWYRWLVGRVTELRGDHDAGLDDAQMIVEGRLAYPDSDSYYVECDPWQCVETDTAPEFELAEVLMNHYILKGRGVAPYYEYAGIPVPVLAGNWKQQ